jgi:hypothetical protein
MYVSVKSMEVNRIKAQAGAGGWISGEVFGLFAFALGPFVFRLFHGK